MDHSFNNINEDRRTIVINNGYTEFANYGFKRSSLNKILTASNASKGFFYYHFKNKTEFYNYLLNFGIDIILEKLQDEKLLQDPDLIRRIQKSAIVKNEIVLKYPSLMDFFTKAYTEQSQEKIMEITNRLASDYSERILSENLDFTLFKDDMPIKGSIKIITRYIAQLTNEIKPMLKQMSFKDIVDYYDKELEELKKAFYKKGEY
jgi:AcrR family transcriptional regulator